MKDEKVFDVLGMEDKGGTWFWKVFYKGMFNGEIGH